MTGAGSALPHLPARRPDGTRLEGREVALEPLDLARDAAGLHAAAAGDPALWDFLSVGPFDDPVALAAGYTALERAGDPVLMTIMLGGAPAGIASFLNVVPAHGSVEIGNIWFGPALQRTRAATEAMYLMMQHAFALGNRRLEWRCNAANARSRRAAERLGFTYEGTLRQHMVIKGRNRDTAFFSLLDSEWPPARDALQRWLDPVNFDVDGRQRDALHALRYAGG